MMKVALIPLKKKDNVIILDIMIKNLPVIPAFLFHSVLPKRIYLCKIKLLKKIV